MLILCLFNTVQLFKEIRDHLGKGRFMAPCRDRVLLGIN